MHHGKKAPKLEKRPAIAQRTVSTPSGLATVSAQRAQYIAILLGIVASADGDKHSER